MARQKRRSVGKRTADAAPTWQQKSKSWRKRITIDGQQKEYRYKYPNTPAGRKQAAQEWSSELARIRAGSELSELENKAQAILASLGDAQSQNYRQIFSHVANQLQAGVPEAESMRRGVSVYSAEKELAKGNIQNAQELLTDAVGKEIEPEAVSVGETVSDVLEQYLADQNQQQQLGAFGISHMGKIRSWVNREKEEMGQAEKPGDEREFGLLVSEYRKRCEKELLAGQYKKGTFDERMKFAGMFFRWASRNYHFPHEPRNLDSLLRKFNAKPEEGAKRIPVDILKTIAENVRGSMSACICLSLNCGFYAADYPHICADDIDGDYLTFTRNKTEAQANNGNGVTVVYRLWPETLELIKRHGNDSGHLLTDGKYPWYREHGKSRTDRLGKEFRKFLKQIKITGYSYRNFRDTGTTIIEETDKQWSDTYGAHSEKRIAQLYIDSNTLDRKQVFAGLHDATDKMRTKLLPVIENLVK